jgi:SAM-dependent methyltransferase
MAGATVGTSESPVSRVGPANLRLRLRDSEVPLGFVQRGNEVYLVGRDRGARWPVALLREGEADLDLGARTVRGRAQLVVDPAERTRILEMFRVEYGDRQFERWYARPARVLRVTVGEASPGPESPEHYREWLSAEFDNVADDYDRHITGNRMNRLLRDRSIALLRERFRGSHQLLEIGCGSGMETLPLAREGHEILCVDISERMLEVVRQKARRDGISERLRTRRLSAGELGRLTAEVGTGAFDGAYSTYGAMNCEEDLEPVAPALHALLRAGGRFVAGVYNRWCGVELVGYGLTGRFGRAFGRAAQPVLVGSSRFCVDVFAYSPATFERIFRRAFVREEVRAVPSILPPSDLTAYAETFSRRFEILDGWDRRLGRRWPFSQLGDHFLMVLARRDAIAA